MHILFASDLHGKMNLYEELLALARAKRVECVLIGGDLLPTRVNAAKLVAGTADFNGSLQAQIAFIDTFLAPRLSAFLRENPHTRVLYIPGNHDWIPAITYLEKTIPGATNLHLRHVLIDGFHFLGYGCVTDSTFWVKDYVRRDFPQDGYVKSRYACLSTSEGIRRSDNGEYILHFPSIEEELATCALDEPEKSICVFHAPPFNTGLDTLHNGRPIGSRALRAFIETRKPLITLHGHIHESPYMSGIYRTNLGDTLSVNPGHAHDRLHAVTFDTYAPHSTLEHIVFGTETPPAKQNLIDSCTLKITSFFMTNVLSK